ncbi:MAG: tetratricopeptide repeat protein [Planctomycetaceae bacterium]
MKTLNVRLLGCLALAAIVIGSGGYFLHAYQVQRHAGAYLREARRAQEENRVSDAVRHFRRYVKLAPHDTEGLALFGLQLAELDQLEPAYLMLDQALRREPDRDEWRRQLVETAIDLGRFGDARANLEDHLLKQHPQDASLLAQLGRCQVALGKNDEAAQSFEASVQAEPQRLEGYILLAGLHQTRFKNPVEADRWMDRMVEANGSDPHAYLARGQWRLDNRNRLSEPASDSTASTVEPGAAGGALEAAQADAGRALELAPKDVETLLFAARVTAVGGQHSEARALALRGLELQPDKVAPYVLLAEIENAAGESSAALDWLRRGVTAIPQDADLRWTLAWKLVEAGQGEEAAEEIQRLRDAGTSPARLEYLEARIAIASEKWLEGIHTLEQARPNLAPWPELTKQADYWLGKCYERLGNPDQQLVAFRRAVAADPTFVPARLGLAGALLATGRIQEAQEHFRFVALRPESPAIAGLRLTQLLVVENFRREPSQRDWNAVTRNLDQLAKAIPDSPAVTLLRAEVLVAQERPDEAARLLEDAHRRDPRQIEFLAARVVLAERAGDHARADRLLDEAKDDVDDAVGYRLLKGRTLVRRDKAEAAAALKEVWRTSETLPATDRARLAGGLAELALTAGDVGFAWELGGLAATAFPRQLEIRRMLLDVAVQSRRTESMDEVLTDIRRIEGEGALWHYGRALKIVMLSDAKNGPPVAALDELTRARTLRPGWSQPVLLTAEIYDRQGETSRATDAYLEAISLGERNVQATARTVKLLFEQKRFVEADQIVRRMQEQNGVFTGDLTRLAAETSLHLKEFDRASDLTESFVAESDRLEDHLWAGQMLEILGRFDEAEARLRRAVEIDPHEPALRVALVRVLVRGKRLEDAEKAIAQIESTVDAEHAAVTVAQCYEVLGRTADAETQYRKALAQSPDDPAVVRRVAEFLLKNRKAAEAEPQLRRLVTGKIAASDDDRVWARRSLAIVLGKRELTEALALLDANQKANGSTAADTRARAIILASQPSAKSRQQAVAALEQLLADEKTASPEDRFLLAELFRRSGDLTRAASELRNVLAVQPDEPRYVSAYVQILIDRGETSEAELWVDRLKSIAPNELPTADLETKVLFANGKAVQAADVLSQVVESAEEGEAASRRLWAAECMTEFSARLRATGQVEAAETLATRVESICETHLQERPGDSLAVAELHARLGKIDKALAAMASSNETLAPEFVESVSVAVMTSPMATTMQLQRLQEILDGLRAKHPDAGPLLVVSADLLGWRGEHAEAETLYRKLLERNADDVRVLNNLALVLALGEKRCEESLALIDRSIAIAGPQGALLDTRGLIQLAAGRAKEAQADFQLALEQGSAADRYLHLAAAQWQSRDKDQAQRTLKKAEELGLAWADLHPLERPLLAGLRSELK